MVRLGLLGAAQQLRGRSWCGFMVHFLLGPLCTRVPEIWGRGRHWRGAQELCTQGARVKVAARAVRGCGGRERGVRAQQHRGRRRVKGRGWQGVGRGGVSPRACVGQGGERCRGGPSSSGDGSSCILL